MSSVLATQSSVLNAQACPVVSRDAHLFCKHVLEEVEKRKISQKLVEHTLSAPEQKVPEVDNITCYQSRVEINGKAYLLRLMVNETMNPAVVVTVYRTSKISKYWRMP